MIIQKIYNYLLSITLFLFILPIFCFAQTPASDSFLELTMKPKNPEPGQSVNITIQSFSYNLDSSKITWYVDGLEKKSGTGLKEFFLQAGKNGEKTVIKVVVQTQNDGPKQIEAFFIPSVVDLVYEFLSYTPPFYKGKALNPYQGVTVVVAIPELIKTTGEKISTQNIIYSWKKNGKVEQAASGVGKNTYIFPGTVPMRDSLIEVTASSLDGSIFASKQVNITNDEPKIIFYEDSPIYGIMFNKAISGTVRMLKDEFKVKAFPFFISAGYTQNPDLNYKWSINGKLSENLDTDKTAMLFRQEGIGAGVANISLKVENTVRIFQFADNGFIINFEKQ
jgi:hypothetical protein